MIKVFSKALFILLMSSTMALTTGVSNPGQTMTLEECINYAMGKQQDVMIADLEQKRSQAKVGEFLSSGLPQVDVNASFNKNFIVRKAFIPANIFDPTAPEGEFLELPFGTPYDGDIGLSLTQMIFNGSYFVGLKASKVYTELSRKDYIMTKIDVIEAVTKAYYTVLVNEIGLELIQANYQRLDSLLRETRIMYENGFAEKIDVNRTQVEFNNIKTQRINNERLLMISKQLLKFQMGMPVNEEIEIAEKLTDLNFEIEEILSMESSYLRRIEYSKLQTSIDLAHIDLKNNRSQYLPKIDLFFGWGMNAGLSDASNLVKWGNRMLWPDYQLAGITMNIPIFDGLYKNKLVQQNKLKIQQLNYQRMMLENSIEFEVEQKRNNLLSNIDLFRSQEENMILAEEVYTHSKIKYQEGVGSNLEVIEADNVFKQSQTNYYNALYEALIAEIEFKKSLGIINVPATDEQQ